MHHPDVPAGWVPTKAAPRRGGARGWLAAALAATVTVAVIAVAVAAASPSRAAASAFEGGPFPATIVAATAAAPVGLADVATSRAADGALPSVGALDTAVRRPAAVAAAGPTNGPAAAYGDAAVAGALPVSARQGFTVGVDYASLDCNTLFTACNQQVSLCASLPVDDLAYNAWCKDTLVQECCWCRRKCGANRRGRTCLRRVLAFNRSCWTGTGR
eukprot:TRINITY_DN3946_c0_g1_i4.p1 TRINITY_DN3946_c0_g1~~TRINITY_DN3946_c0_g1_i4.p1  ORF type:complete len:216 (-),score=34.63 TRINITY_DN3946_c0_g1_i4:280-927(-)